VSDLTDYIGARKARLTGDTTTTSASTDGYTAPGVIANVYLRYAIDPDLSDAGRAEALAIATVAGEAALAEANEHLARETRRTIESRIGWPE
jgi:hypothetical protein